MTQSNPSPNSFTQQNEREKRREPEVPGEEAPVVECFEKVAPSRMLVLQDKEWLQIWGEVLLCTSSD